MARNPRVRSERGATATEYGLLITGIAAVLVVVIFAFGGTIRDGLFGNTCNSVATNASQRSCS